MSLFYFAKDIIPYRTVTQEVPFRILLLGTKLPNLSYGSNLKEI